MGLRIATLLLNLRSEFTQELAYLGDISQPWMEGKVERLFKGCKNWFQGWVVPRTPAQWRKLLGLTSYGSLAFYEWQCPDVVRDTLVPRWMRRR